MNVLRIMLQNKLIFFIIGLVAYSNNVYGQQSLYEDPKANQPGDLLTVILAENISGSFNTDQSRNSATDGDASGSISSNFIPFQPVFGADAEVNYNSDERIRANQSQLLQGSLSVRVEEVLANRHLFIRGERTTEINGELHEIKLSGIVRPSDITNNSVYSFHIANAEIFYQKKDNPKQVARRPGFVRKIIFGAVGVLVGTVAVTRAID